MSPPGNPGYDAGQGGLGIHAQERNVEGEREGGMVKLSVASCMSVYTAFHCGA